MHLAGIHSLLHQGAALQQLQEVVGLHRLIDLQHAGLHGRIGVVEHRLHQQLPRVLRQQVPEVEDLLLTDPVDASEALLQPGGLLS
jgi:hypothetical protein